MNNAVRKICTPIALCLIMSPAHATVTYSWPYTAYVEIDITSATTATYTQHMSVAPMTNPNMPPGMTNFLTLQNTPIGATTDAWWGQYHRHQQLDNPNAVASVTKLYHFHPNDIFTDSANEIARKYGTGTLIQTHSGSPNGNECVGTTLYDNSTVTGNDPIDTFHAHSWNGGVTTAQESCIGTPPANEWCALLTPELTLNYPNMKVENAAGATVSGDVQVHCTTGMKYTLRLRTPMGIALSNGMTAQLTANGLPLNSALDGETGDNTVKITSTLEGSPEKSGDFKGESILFVSYP